MRLFTAIPLPEDIKIKISPLFRGRLPVSYINTANLHITLNFFGELESSDEQKIKDVFIKAAQNYEQFLIEFLEIVKFHQQIHLTLKSNKALIDLQHHLEKKFLTAGFKFQDREYYPHVKIANLHMDQVMNQDRKFENFPNEILSQLNFDAQSVVLYESKLLMHHAHHTPLLEVKLL